RGTAGREHQGARGVQGGAGGEARYAAGGEARDRPAREAGRGAGGEVRGGGGRQEAVDAEAGRLHRRGHCDPEPLGGGSHAGEPRPTRLRCRRAAGPAGRWHLVPPARGTLRERGAGGAGEAEAARPGGRLPCLRGLAMSAALPRGPAWGRRAGTVWPPREDYRGLIERGNLIPVSREILADLETPVSAFLKIHRGPYGFLLESVQGGERWGRFSF